MSEKYLSRWAEALRPGLREALERPVTEVSWFADRAYCRWRGARLPTTDEREYAAQASETRRHAFRDKELNSRVLALYLPEHAVQVGHAGWTASTPSSVRSPTART